MKNIDILNRYEVQFYKPVWNDNETELAACLSITLKDGYHTADIRVTNNKSLFVFLRTCFPSILLSDSSKVFRKELFSRLKKMYKDLHDEFLDVHYKSLGYRKVNLLAFEQGLGKTLTSASMSKILKVNRTIIVCPTLVKWNWLDDMTKDWGYDSLLWTILDRTKSKCLHAFLTERFVVVNYEMVEKHFEYLTRSNVGHIIIDEAHLVKNVNALRTKNVIKLINHFPETRVTLLTGTPFTNRITDMFAYLKIAKHPLGKSITKFREKYAVMGGRNKIIGAKDVPDLRDKISNFMIRRKADECLDLPDLIIKNFYFDVGELSGEYSEKMEELAQLKDEYDKLEGREKAQKGVEMRGNIHSLNRLASESKVEPIIKLIDSLHEQGKKVIVFSGYTAPLDMLEEHYGTESIKINGSVGAHKRQALINRYKTDPNCRVFLGNFKAAGVGINLVNANHVIFMNFPFTPDDLEQPYKRAHRIGQTEKVHVYYTLGRGTIDERVYEIIKDKSADINSLIDNNKNVVNYGSIEGQLFKSLIADYNKQKGIITKEETGFVSVK